ncbi:hypothetical protein PFISCL1PPCAC_15391, partial [Pristionchus fissidentatus]
QLLFIFSILFTLSYTILLCKGGDRFSQGASRNQGGIMGKDGTPHDSAKSLKSKSSKSAKSVTPRDKSNKQTVSSKKETGTKEKGQGTKEVELAKEIVVPIGKAAKSDREGRPKSRMSQKENRKKDSSGRNSGRK